MQYTQIEPFLFAVRYEETDESYQFRKSFQISVYTKRSHPLGSSDLPCSSPIQYREKMA